MAASQSLQSLFLCQRLRNDSTIITTSSWHKQNNHYKGIVQTLNSHWMNHIQSCSTDNPDNPNPSSTNPSSTNPNSFTCYWSSVTVLVLGSCWNDWSNPLRAPELVYSSFILYSSELTQSLCLSGPCYVRHSATRESQRNRHTNTNNLTADPLSEAAAIFKNTIVFIIVFISEEFNVCLSSSQ